MKTDAEGKVVFSFTTPDALTEWKLMLLAHSPDLKTGSFVSKIKARKDLMIMPNLPRFVRQGDVLVFAAKLVNNSSEVIDASVSIEFFDVLSGKTVNIFTGNGSSASLRTLKPNSNELLQWEIKIPSNLAMLGYRITAGSESFTDAEERLIPVLTNRMLVTETLPMHIKGGQEKVFRFDKLLDQDERGDATLKNYRFTLEFTSNPAWYAVQALPYLDELERENSLSVFYQLYANQLSAFILDKNPRIKQVFESWQQVSPDAFQSQLMKNQELKSVVLEATPWLLEAEDEAEQKRRIALLFDVNTMAMNKSTVIEKLKNAQMSNGGWPWFKGMPDDRHVTQQIVIGLSRLIEKGVLDPRFRQGYSADAYQGIALPG